MSRKRKKKVTVAQIGRAGMIDLAPVEVDDPYDPGKKRIVMKNNETTPIDAEYARKSITPDQKLAADRFLALYEQIEIGGAKAIDYSRPKVDGGQIYMDVAIGAAEAQERLDGIRSYIGRKSYELLVSVIGNRLSVDSLASSETTKWRRDMVSFHIRKCLRETLQEVCDHMGIVAKGRGRRAVRVNLEDAA